MTGTGAQRIAAALFRLVEPRFLCISVDALGFLTRHTSMAQLRTSGLDARGCWMILRLTNAVYSEEFQEITFELCGEATL